MQEFEEYTQPGQGFFQNLWSRATVVLDSNALLDLYRYPQDACTSLQAILQALADRIFTPHHAALEFHRNRPLVINGQLRQFDTVLQSLEKLIAQFEKELDNQRLKERHSLIAPDDIKEELRKAHDAIRSELQRLRLSAVHVEDDPILEWWNQHLRRTVGPAPRDQASLDKLYQEASRRYAALIPPGFCDEKKGNGAECKYSYRGLVYERMYGDYLIWEQTIAHALESGTASLFLVTDDSKKDWLLRHGEKTIGPHPALRGEIATRAAVSEFWIYSVPRFLEFGRQHLGVEISDKSIAQAHQISGFAGGYVEGVDPEGIVDSVLQDFAFGLMDHDSLVTSEMAMTNAVFDYSQSDIGAVNYDESSNEILFDARLYLNGDSDPDKSFCGDKITVDVEGTIGQLNGHWEVLDYNITKCRSNFDDADK